MNYSCKLVRLGDLAVVQNELIKKMKTTAPNCGEDFSIVLNSYTDGRYKMECRHGTKTSKGTVMVHVWAFYNHTYHYSVGRRNQYGKTKA